MGDPKKRSLRSLSFLHSLTLQGFNEPSLDVNHCPGAIIFLNLHNHPMVYIFFYSTKVKTGAQLTFLKVGKGRLKSCLS